ncbi:hypothetical protein FA15DRAFT_665617 [Coprinopsis marcescibilis]|uniref:Uncharacterized protein n=1 Tax=Coprinopsis marcescibilis TaxID=230819 RepID=A0A5C3L641_COPMA|nr:hypothetical protein FA15DRAFT_665617 [Coprinopsis marcescibilis]
MLFKPFFVVVALVAGVFAQETTLRVETPLSVIVCRPILINFSGGEGPYFLSIVRSRQQEVVVHDFDEVATAPQRWVVNVEPGTELVLNIRDQTGLLRQSGPFIIQDGPNTDCVGQEPSDTPSGPTEGSTPGGGASTPAGPGASSPSRTPSAPSPSGPANTNAAGGSGAAANAIPAVLAGVVGAAAVLLA